jgi:hypothetical protein
LKLTIRVIEISRIKPSLEARTESRPLDVRDRVPRGIAIAAFRERLLPKSALAAKSEPSGSRTRGRIQAAA